MLFEKSKEHEKFNISKDRFLQLPLLNDIVYGKNIVIETRNQTIRMFVDDIDPETLDTPFLVGKEIKEYVSAYHNYDAYYLDNHIAVNTYQITSIRPFDPGQTNFFEGIYQKQILDNFEDAEKESQSIREKINHLRSTLEHFGYANSLYCVNNNNDKLRLKTIDFMPQIKADEANEDNIWALFECVECKEEIWLDILR